MPKHRAEVRCFIDNAIREAGEIFNYDGPPSAILTLVEQAEEPQEIERRKPGRQKKQAIGSGDGAE